MIGAVPARFSSTRLPGKPLLGIAGKPMIRHVVERASRADGLDRVIVLTDDERIAEAVAAFGGEVEMTPAECASGTDRIAFAARGWDCAAVVNIQGDEPLIEPAAIDRIAERLAGTDGDAMVTLAAPADPARLTDENVVKVVTDRDGNALYFSRAPIPYPRGEGAAPMQHIGIYGYRRATLLELAALPRSPLERSESLEQLRALENGIPIRVLTVDRGWPGVDTMDDLERVERLIESKEGEARWQPSTSS